jgi:hypothetical protein
METATSWVIQVPGRLRTPGGRPAGLVADCRCDGGPKLAGRLTRAGSVRLAAVVSSAQRRAERLAAVVSILQCRGEFPDHANIDLASPRSSFADDDGCRGDERLHTDDPNQIGRVRVVGRMSGGPGSPRRPVRLPGVSLAVAAPLPVGRLR